MKAQVKRALAKMGLSLHRVPPGIVVGFDLGRDLAIVMGDRRSPVCIDVGAHVGQFVDLLRSSLRDPSIHAFEPAPEPFARLQSHCGAMPNVTLVNAGLGSEGGQISFNVYDNQTLNSFLPMLATGTGTLGGPKLVRSIPVPVHRLDDYAASAGLARIDLLKIDTQGYELKILRGASRLLADGRVRTILLELNFVPLYDGQVWAHEIIGFLHERGFCLVDFYEKCRLNPLLGWCTALFTVSEPPPK
jgi:FkbM family methyltransferase